tara:strand:+ start:3106 stop:3297 length:192 start_codon:yes stop_codon:yes gene_type:complete
MNPEVKTTLISIEDKLNAHGWALDVDTVPYCMHCGAREYEAHPKNCPTLINSLADSYNESTMC